MAKKRTGSWIVVDNESAKGPGERLKVLGRFDSEISAAKWISQQPDVAKVERGGFGLDPPRGTCTEVFTPDGALCNENYASALWYEAEERLRKLLLHLVQKRGLSLRDAELMCYQALGAASLHALNRLSVERAEREKRKKG